ncbi:UNVERIFIED_CONTAM: hypothetical protein Scaly_1172200 [Sesamum calycinum]|uniref:Aminotransferase-like plant mobile domain-containing protein n=1 Tax=Sesamum calycinum TaxID=2727403 RepID=A0AAW2Q373_9LAMI
MHFGRSIIGGDVKCDGNLRFIGEFSYTKGYWEWTEDVLNRCGDRLRHLKIHDVVYASLYDHNSDIVKAFCETWYPLTNTLLTSVGELSISLWDLHELAGLPMMGCLYDEVAPKKKTVRPKSTHNPLGDIAIHERWSTAEETLFAKLCIERNLNEEAYLAAYLACLLCVFVLSNKDVNFIHPSTFKMESLMPSVCYFKTHYLVWQELRGPKMTRFSGEGGAKCYELREARKRMHKSEFVSWACNMLVKDGPFNFVDYGNGEELDHNYFVAIHSSYLILFKPKKFIIEPYSPHKFGRQFGPKSIKITLKCKKNEDKQVDGGENNPSHAFVPPVVIKCDSQAAVVEASKGKGSLRNLADSDSSNKDPHWKRQKKELTPLKVTGTNESASRSSLSDFIAKLEDEIQSIDTGEKSETSNSSTMTPPLRMGLKRKQSPHPVAVSVFEVDFLSSIEDDVYIILESMKSFHKFDVSKVEESLSTIFVKFGAYDKAKSLFSEKLSRNLHEQQLKEAKARLQDVQAKASEEASEVQSAMASWSILRKRL